MSANELVPESLLIEIPVTNNVFLALPRFFKLENLHIEMPIITFLWALCNRHFIKLSV